MTWAEYAGLHAGRRGFVLATGASVAEQDIGWLAGEIVIGVNFAHRITGPLGWFPQYMATTDWKLMRGEMAEEWAALPSRVAVADFTQEASPYGGGNLLHPDGIPWHVANRRDGTPSVEGGVFRVLYNGTSTGNMGLPLAVYLGLNPIYLLGCDCSTGGHAYDPPGERCASGGPLHGSMRVRFVPAMGRWAAHLARRGVLLYNATRGGGLETVPRVDFDSLKEAAPCRA